MKKFILLYNGPATPPEDMSPEERNDSMAKWSEWMKKIGKGLVDMGQPMANGEAISDDGTEVEASLLNGYSIIQAKDMEEAKEMVEGHPFLSDETGDFCVEIHELLPAPKM
jgi:hypothetical protein